MNNQTQIKTGVIGATGYAGIELVSFLDAHPHFDLVAVASSSSAGKSLSSYYPKLIGTKSDKTLISIDEIIKKEIELLFLAVPHTTAFELVKQALDKGMRVVDLSADFRLKDANLYNEHYLVTHPNPKLLDRAVYGLSEVFGHKEIKSANLIANPGCYPTASTLALAPFFKSKFVELLEGSIVIDAKSGVSGAGRKSTAATHFVRADESLYGYKAFVHQHTPEIEQSLYEISGQDIKVAFVPHLVPAKRGLLASCYLHLVKPINIDEIFELYSSYYSAAPFVKLIELGKLPDFAHLRGTNTAHIGMAYDERAGVLTLACAIDNLGKGAATQALQNANIMFGLAEDCGLMQAGGVI